MKKKYIGYLVAEVLIIAAAILTLVLMIQGRGETFPALIPVPSTEPKDEAGSAIISSIPDNGWDTSGYDAKNLSVSTAYSPDADSGYTVIEDSAPKALYGTRESLEDMMPHLARSYFPGLTDSDDVMWNYRLLYSETVHDYGVPMARYEMAVSAYSENAGVDPALMQNIVFNFALNGKVYAISFWKPDDDGEIAPEFIDGVMSELIKEGE